MIFREGQRVRCEYAHIQWKGMVGTVVRTIMTSRTQGEVLVNFLKSENQTWPAAIAGRYEWDAWFLTSDLSIWKPDDPLQAEIMAYCRRELSQ